MCASGKLSRSPITTAPSIHASNYTLLLICQNDRTTVHWVGTEFLCRILVVFFFSSGPFESSYLIRPTQTSLYFSSISPRQVRGLDDNVLMCKLLGLEIFLRSNDITRGWRSWALECWCQGKQQIKHKRSNSPYCYQCKNRGFVLSLLKQYKTNKISAFPALFLCLYHLLSYSHWLLTICNSPTIPS